MSQEERKLIISTAPYEDLKTILVWISVAIIVGLFSIKSCIGNACNDKGAVPYKITMHDGSIVRARKISGFESFGFSTFFTVKAKIGGVTFWGLNSIRKMKFLAYNNKSDVHVSIRLNSGKVITGSTNFGYGSICAHSPDYGDIVILVKNIRLIEHE